jgi:hypothetical protein
MIELLGPVLAEPGQADQHGSLEECAWSQEDLCCLGEGAIWVARCTEGDQKIVGLCRCREDFPMIV